MSLHRMSLHLDFTGNTPYTVFVRVMLLAAGFAIYLLDMLAKLKGDTDTLTNTSILPISN